MKFFDVVVSQPWALLEARAEEYRAILNGESEFNPEALEAYRAKQSQTGERLTVRNGVGILKVQGPLLKRATWFAEVCGMTSYEVLRRDLQAALDDPSVKSIMLAIDSPGGEANGCDELATAIFEARGVKPITAYVSGMAASGGYWIASAADRVVVSELAILGSIGVVLGVEDKTAAEERRGVRNIQFVSSQSPGKRPDPTTDQGRTQIQTMVDDLAEVFISAVARNRGVSTEDVISKFGAGGVKIGAKAVAAGMADEVGQFEAVLASVVKRGSGRTNQGVFIMSDETKNGPSAEEIKAAAATDAKTRIKAITASDDGKMLPKLAEHLAFDTDLDASAAAGILKVAKADLDVAKASQPAPESKADQPPQGAQSYEDRKREAGALGFGANEPRGDKNADAAAAGWKKATANANASIGVKN